MKLTIEVNNEELDLITGCCWLRPLKGAVDYLNSHPDREAGDHAYYEIEPLYKTESIRQKLVSSYFRECNRIDREKGKDDVHRSVE